MNKIYSLYDFNAENEKEVSIVSDEALYYLGSPGYDGWIYVRKLNGQEGLVPLSYTSLDTNFKQNVEESEDSGDENFTNSEKLTGQLIERKNSQRTHSISTIYRPKVNLSKNSAGIEGFLLYGVQTNTPDCEVTLNESGESVWSPRSLPYKVEIVNYLSDKKYYGAKKFISYEIQTEQMVQRVKRRYNQFDWLHKRLEEKYPNICIPPLPDKAVTGNFEDEFIMKRKAQLELWLNRLSSHPVISVSEVFIHFLHCDDTDSKWKAGKRKAEKDQYRGAQWFCKLSVPNQSVDTTTSIKDKIEKFSKATIYLDISIKNVCLALEKLNSIHMSSYKKELNNLGKRLEEFGSALSADSLDSANNSALSRAMVTSGNIYNQIANSYGEQSKEDIGPLLDRLSLYRGIIQQMPDIVQFEKSAIQTYEEFQQKPEKLQGRSLIEVAPRSDIISHVTFAEINHFNKEKVDDLVTYMRTFLQKQIAFYTEITDCLKRAYSDFDQIPSKKN